MSENYPFGVIFIANSAMHYLRETLVDLTTIFSRQKTYMRLLLADAVTEKPATKHDE